MEPVPPPVPGPIAGTAVLDVAGQRTVDGRPFPLALGPADASTASPRRLTELVEDNRDGLLHLIATHGAVLMRGWDGASTLLPSDPACANDFAATVAALKLCDFAAACSAAPRTPVAPAVFTANEAPPTELIPFHHEMAQCPTQPNFVIFFCEAEAVRRARARPPKRTAPLGGL